MDSDGAVFKASSSGVVSVPDEYSAELSASNAVRNGILSTSRSFGIGTRGTRRCTHCRRNWQSWSETCPKCTRPTTVV
jgi:hypothetical protein